MIEELDHWKKKEKTYEENLKLMKVTPLSVKRIHDNMLLERDQLSK